MPVVIPNQAAPHIAIGVVLDGVHWHCDVGYGGRGLRLPIRNDLVQTSENVQTISGQLCTSLTYAAVISLCTCVAGHIALSVVHCGDNSQRWC